MPGQSNPPKWLTEPIATLNKNIQLAKDMAKIGTVWKDESFSVSSARSKMKKDPYDANGTNMDNILKHGFDIAHANVDPYEGKEGGDILEAYNYDVTVDYDKEAREKDMLIDPKNLDPYGLQRQEGVWMVNCDSWGQRGISPLFYNVNPSQVTWTMPLRSAIQKTRSGMVTHVWGDRNKGKYSIFDNPTINITWQSGSILPYKIIKDSNKRKLVPAGIDRFYQMLDLLGNTQSILDDGTQNRIHITYRSLMFPKITLTGVFDTSGITFSDSADSPTSFTYDTTFHIQNSTPSLSGTAIKKSLLSGYTSPTSWKKPIVKRR